MQASQKPFEDEIAQNKQNEIFFGGLRKKFLRQKPPPPPKIAHGQLVEHHPDRSRGPSYLDSTMPIFFLCIPIKGGGTYSEPLLAGLLGAQLFAHGCIPLILGDYSPQFFN